MITASRNHGRVRADWTPRQAARAAVTGLRTTVSLGPLALGPLLATTSLARSLLGLSRRADEDRREVGTLAEDPREPEHALAEHRRKLAADIHDLILQDLSFALAHARTLAHDPELAPRARPLVAAGERALAGAREVMAGLARAPHKPVVEAVEASVRTAARKTPVSFHAHVSPSAQADQPTHEALVHIGREAVTNAVKHAGARAGVEVVFEHGDEWRLTVRDRGCGFNPASAPIGFGLHSMQARARELGGSLRITSVVGQGSTVEASLP